MAIAPVVISFLAQGMPQVQQAFQSIHAAAVKAERAQQIEADKTTKAVKKSVDERVKMQIAAMRKADAMQRQAWAAGDREAARSAKAQEQTAGRAERAKLKALKDRIAASKVAEKELDSWQKGAARQQEQEASRAEKAKYKAIHDRIARTKQAEKDLDAWQRTQQRSAAKDEAAAARTGRRSNAAVGRVVESVVGATARGVGAGLSRAGNMAMGLATTASQLGGGFSIADSVMGEKNMRKEAAVLSAKTMLNGGREFSTNEILSKAKAVGIAQAIDPSEVMAGYDEIQKLTGNSEMAFTAMPGVAKIATATGADLQDTSKLAANILSADPTMSAKELNKQLRIFTRQGLVGGVEVNEFAKYGSRITGSASLYGGKVEDNEVTLGAMAQMARQYGTASGAPEAMMGSQRFGSDVMKHAKDLEGKGIKVRDGKKMRDAESIILDMLKKTDGDVFKLNQLGLGERGVRPVLGAAAIYRNAGGGAKGEQAVKDEFAKYRKGTSEEDIDKANERVLAEQGFEKSMLELKIAAGEQLLPVFKQMIPELQKLIPQFVQLAKVGIPAFTDLMGVVAKFAPALASIVDAIGPIPTIIGYELTKSFAAAGLPALLRYLVSSMAPGGGGVGGAVGGAAGGKLGSGLAYGAVAVTSAEVLYNAYANREAGDKRADDLAGDVKSGKVSADTASQEVAAARGRRDAYFNEHDSAGELAKRALIPGYNIYAAQRDGSQAGDSSFIDNEKLQRAITEAAAAGVRDGVSSGLKNNSGSSGAGRSESILSR